MPDAPAALTRRDAAELLTTEDRDALLAKRVTIAHVPQGAITPHTAASAGSSKDGSLGDSSRRVGGRSR